MTHLYPGSEQADVRICHNFMLKLHLICTKKQQSKLFIGKLDVMLNICWDVSVEVQLMICRIENLVDLDSLLVKSISAWCEFLGCQLTS